MGNRQNDRPLVQDLVVHGVREMPQDEAAYTLGVDGPRVGRFAKAVYCFEYLGTERIGGDRTALPVPTKCLADLRLGFGQKFNREPRHNESIRARASAHGTGVAVPDFMACLRRPISSRHASVIEASALPSMLSSNAITKAERSSVGKQRAWVNNSSTRAFMR